MFFYENGDESEEKKMNFFTIFALYKMIQRFQFEIN